MKEFLVLKDNPYLGQYYTKVFYDLKKECNAILVGIVKKGEHNERVLLKNPEGSVTINEGDYLIMLSNQETEKQIVRLFGTMEGFAE
jgi:Trk K+ transport system NAD-binding subunit